MGVPVGGAWGACYHVTEGPSTLATELGDQPTVDRLQALGQMRELTRPQLEQVVELAELVRVGRGEVLARERRIGREFFLILSGTVVVTQGGHRIETLGPGDIFGELTPTDPGPRHATVTALSDVDVLIVGPREFAAMAEIPGLLNALYLAMVPSPSLAPDRDGSRE